MAVKTQKKKAASRKKDISFPLEKQNLIIIGIGIAMLIVGYLMMAQNSVNGFVPTVLSPLILVAAYCVVIPYGILKRVKTETTSQPLTAEKTETAGNVKAG